jgi:hypothetical protein
MNPIHLSNDQLENRSLAELNHVIRNADTYSADTVAVAQEMAHERRSEIFKQAIPAHTKIEIDL